MIVVLELIGWDQKIGICYQARNEWASCNLEKSELVGCSSCPLFAGYNNWLSIVPTDWTLKHMKQENSGRKKLYNTHNDAIWSIIHGASWFTQEILAPPAPPSQHQSPTSTGYIPPGPKTCKRTWENWPIQKGHRQTQTGTCRHSEITQLTKWSTRPITPPICKLRSGTVGS